MKQLYQWSVLLGLLSYVIGGVFRRSESFPGELSMGLQMLVILLLLILPAGIGVVLGVLSWKRKEVSLWWAGGAIVLNIAVLLTSMLLLLPG